MSSFRKTPLLHVSVALLFITVALVIYDAYTKETKRPTATQACEAQFALLLDNADPTDWGLTIRGGRKYKTSTSYPFEWSVTVYSKDRAFRQVFTGPELCPLLDTAWEKLDAYNAYVNDNKAKP